MPRSGLRRVDRLIAGSFTSFRQNEISVSCSFGKDEVSGERLSSLPAGRARPKSKPSRLLIAGLRSRLMHARRRARNRIRNQFCSVEPAQRNVQFGLQAERHQRYEDSAEVGKLRVEE